MLKLMKNPAFLILWSLFFLLPPLLSAQSRVLTGAIVIGNAEVMSYKIYYDLMPNNTLSGYSISDENGKSQTRATIAGYFNPKKKILFFEERKVTDSKLQMPVDEFCLMQVTGKLEKKGQNIVYTGKFEGRSYNKNIICDSGSIMLMSEKALDNLAAKTTKALEKASKSDTISKVTTKTPVNWTKNEIEAGSGEIKSFLIKSNEIQIDLVDDRFQDGDRITLMMNDATVAKSLEVTNKVKSYSFKLSADDREVTFKIIAENEGSVALTTVKAALRNGNEVNMININLNKGESVKLVLKR